VRTRGNLAALPPRLARPARVVQHVLAYESISPELQDTVHRELGMNGLMELVTLAGAYRLIAGAVLRRRTSLGAHGAIRPVQLSASMNWRQRP